MKLYFADNQKEIAWSPGADYQMIPFAKASAHVYNRVVQIGKHCQFCGTEEKDLRSMSLDEMFSFCCERAQLESRLVREKRNLCDLCGQYSFKSVTHKECHDRENAEMDYARGVEESGAFYTSNQYEQSLGSEINLDYF